MKIKNYIQHILYHYNASKAFLKICITFFFLAKKNIILLLPLNNRYEHVEYSNQSCLIIIKNVHDSKID